MADMKKLADEIVEKIKKDPQIAKKFASDPVATLEKMSGIDLPDGSVDAVVAAVKAKMAGAGAMDALKKLF